MNLASVNQTNNQTEFDSELIKIAEYITDYTIHSDLAFDTARLCLMDSLGCAILALQYPACTNLLGPIIPGTVLPGGDYPLGSRVPGTQYILDPILAAFNIGTLVRWLDFNDTWLAAEWGHPSDNLGAILAITDYISRVRQAQKKSPFLIKDVLRAMIKAHEIQGVLALENSFNRLGFDHVLLVKLASTAVATHLLGGTREEIIYALSQAFLDGAGLRAYRHAPNTGSRKSWAAGDATSRATRLAWMTMQGEKGYRSILSVKNWGFNDCILKGNSLKFPQMFNSYVMENVLFKISYPAEFHAQTAVECAIKLNPLVTIKLNQIERIIIHTQEPAIRIISKTGPLRNPADRDHCLQYMVAIGLIYGDLRAEHYEEEMARDPRIDQLRQKMIVAEDPNFTRDYLDPEKRSIGNAIQLFFIDGTNSEKVQIEYPIGHRKRRTDGIPLLYEKFKNNLSKLYSEKEIAEFINLFQHSEKLDNMPVNDFMDKFAK